MRNRVLRLPWPVAAVGVGLLTVVLAGASYYFTGPLFHETCHNERNLLTGEFEASNCGEGAKVAKRLARQTPAGDEEVASTPSAPEVTPTADEGEKAGPETGQEPAGVLARGRFRDGDPRHQGSGSAEIQRLAEGALNLFISDFSVTNGPDLVVVLSTDPKGSRGSVSSGITLGGLKANNGSQNYGIPEGTDITQYGSVIIYCKSFPTVFAYAPLEAAE